MPVHREACWIQPTSQLDLDNDKTRGEACRQTGAGHKPCQESGCAGSGCHKHCTAQACSLGPCATEVNLHSKGTADDTAARPHPQAATGTAHHWTQAGLGQRTVALVLRCTCVAMASSQEKRGDLEQSSDCTSTCGLNRNAENCTCSKAVVAGALQLPPGPPAPGAWVPHCLISPPGPLPLPHATCLRHPFHALTCNHSHLFNSCAHL